MIVDRRIERMKVVIWGAGGHAKVVSEIISHYSNYEIVGYIDNTIQRKAQEVLHDIPIYGDLDDVPVHKTAPSIVVAIGNTAVRRKIVETVQEKGFNFASVIHPRAHVAKDVTIGNGTVVMAAAVINSASVIGNHVIINTSSSIDHDCTIGDFAHIAPGAHLGGWVNIGENSFVGLGSSIRDRVTIGSGVTVGTGSTVIKNIADDCTAFGVPAKLI